MATDYVAHNSAFLYGSSTYTFDRHDEDELRCISFNLSEKEMLAVAFLRHLRMDVVDMNKSLIMGFGGKHRSGKSLMATTIAYMLDPTFWERRQFRIVQTAEAFSTEMEYIRKNRIKGACIIIDEGGVVVPSDSFYEEWYKILNQSIQIMGYLNPIIFFCAVIRDNIGAKFRKLFHMQAQCSRYSNEFNKTKIYYLHYDDIKGKTIPKRPRVRLFGRRHILNSVEFGKPPQFIIDAYRELTEPMKDKALESHNKKIANFAAEGDVKAGSKPPKFNKMKVIDDVMQELEKYRRVTSSGVFKIDKAKLQLEKGLKPLEAAVVASEIERIQANRRI